MRLTCPQSRECSQCGETIVRFHPRQQWMVAGSLSPYCVSTQGMPHKPAPLKSRW